MVNRPLESKGIGTLLQNQVAFGSSGIKNLERNTSLWYILKMVKMEVESLIGLSRIFHSMAT
ncbi:hypothetical protein A8B98_24775 [Hymenobacter sp. UV11]|nr:hypothetical protein A8B98_24775 [Hymenobacter sp. UV11]